jgi:hypothetical protein
MIMKDQRYQGLFSLPWLISIFRLLYIKIKIKKMLMLILPEEKRQYFLSAVLQKMPKIHFVGKEMMIWITRQAKEAMTANSKATIARNLCLKS